MSKGKVLYKPLGMAFGMAGGLLAGAAFRKTWKLATGQDDAPDGLDQERKWREILPAVAVEGAIFAVVRTAVERGGATVVRRMTGYWPD
ncbi:DUF4235 domain-containing protein [Streptomyces candidus]|uniref:DUF4235 domain-containing protein n=1 Tax=Streptomyces candidus TaxID=67283 RepID=A0A7X0HE87_9ACTN|nr:DUF4235 domain-containing protein [Streptomyces candidus]MBB6434677.1 hypothetical protein [Streptomyces candidus]GHH35817.1 membrane protein [Streptomyces candidus]